MKKILILLVLAVAIYFGYKYYSENIGKSDDSKEAEKKALKSKKSDSSFIYMAPQESVESESLDVKPITTKKPEKDLATIEKEERQAKAALTSKKKAENIDEYNKNITAKLDLIKKSTVSISSGDTVNVGVLVKMKGKNFVVAKAQAFASESNKNLKIKAFDGQELAWDILFCAKDRDIAIISVAKIPASAIILDASETVGEYDEVAVLSKKKDAPEEVFVVNASKENLRHKLKVEGVHGLSVDALILGVPVFSWEGDKLCGIYTVESTGDYTATYFAKSLPDLYVKKPEFTYSALRIDNLSDAGWYKTTPAEIFVAKELIDVTRRRMELYGIFVSTGYNEHLYERDIYYENISPGFSDAFMKFRRQGLDSGRELSPTQLAMLRKQLFKNFESVLGSEQRTLKGKTLPFYLEDSQKAYLRAYEYFTQYVRDAYAKKVDY